MKSKSYKTTIIFSLLCLVLMVFQQGCCVITGDCPKPTTVPDTFISAFIRTDGKVQTNYSSDGVTWNNGYIHQQLGTIEKGVGLAANSLATYLCFFDTNPAGQNRLILRTGVGNNWDSSIFPQINVSSNSAPAICIINNRYIFAAWQNGSCNISTALADTHNLTTHNSFRILGDINDHLASKIEGAPSVSSLGDKVLIVWKNKEGGHVYNLSTFIPQDQNINFGASRTLNAPLPDLTRGEATNLDGFPQVTSNNTNFFLSVTCDLAIRTESSEDGLVTEQFVSYKSSNGTNWEELDCESNNILGARFLPHSITVNKDGQISQLISPYNSRHGGAIRQNCKQLAFWDASSAFDNKGKAGEQPAIIFRKGS